jgi:SAM-dependent methyltransferase
MAVDPTNQASAQAWDGDEGAYWAANHERFDRSIAAHHAKLMAAAAIQSGERVLDIGCGTGQTTREAALAAPDGSALGVDLSREMLEVARKLTADQGHGNAMFEHADAQIEPFEPGGFDLVLSRTGTMFFGDRDAAFGNLARATRQGGRLATIVWQGLGANEWMREIMTALTAGRDLPAPPPGAPGPFAFADPDDSHRVLTAAGYTDVQVEGYEAPMWFGADADDAHAFILGLMGWLLRDVDDDTARRAQDDLHATCAAHATSAGVEFGSGAWLVCARRAG